MPVEILDATLSRAATSRGCARSCRPRIVGIYVDLMTRRNALG